MSPAPYADWSRYSTPSADLILHEGPLVGSPQNRPFSECSQWQSVHLDITNPDTGVYIQVTIGWSEYVGGGTIVLQQKFIVGPQQTATIVRPVLGRTVQVAWTVLSGAQSSGVTYTLVGTSGYATKYDVASQKTSLFDDTSSYAAGGSATLSAKYWYEGPAQVALFSNNNTAAWVEFRYYDASDQLFHDFAIVQALSWPNSVPHTIHFPPAPVQAFVDNQGAIQTIALHVLPISVSGGVA